MNQLWERVGDTGVLQNPQDEEPALPSPAGLLIEMGSRDLTVINNNACAGGDAIARLFQLGRVRKVVCSLPKAIAYQRFQRPAIPRR